MLRTETNELNAENDARSFARRLQTERKARGQTQNDVAALLGVARTTVVAVEKGERALTPIETMRLAEVWNVKVSDLVRQRRAGEPLAPQLRAAAPTKQLKPGENDALWHSAEKLRILSENYLELEDLAGNALRAKFPPVYEVGIMPPGETAEDISLKIPSGKIAEDIALRERQRLGLSDGPIPYLRALLENEVGLRVFLLPLPSRIAGMFAFDPTLGACVALNVAHPSERRLYTLAHEYFHFLTERYRADVCTLQELSSKRASSSEKMADAFAACFLMPASGLRRRFYELKAAKTDGAVTPGDLLHLKRQYGVSFAALTLRLEELGLVRAGILKTLQDAGFSVREAEAHAGFSPGTREEALPERMRVLAATALIEGEISEGRAARLLDCDRIEIRRIADELWGSDPLADRDDLEFLETSQPKTLEGVA